ncbi:hypothetical protein [Moraxella nasicaprae]|uniref:DUF3828 domain-containing protein n=1 Tax=Moraxella nasicaprae TaxID=2904122 RepID=A0ABY6F5I9_9GAMM|nr:hypothetical protein [Moraxella nasicaprae]UXZ05355.1 hypothetical protein LU297_02595 [Moraxella nasicaprae]
MNTTIKAVLCGALVIYSGNALAESSNSTAAAKIAVVKKVMANVHNDNLIKYASRSLRSVMTLNYKLENQLQEAICIDGHIAGTDFSVSHIRKTAKYKALSNGDIAVSFKGYPSSSTQTVYFTLIQENGRYVIDDYYQAEWDSTFKQELQSCLAEF